MTVADTAIEWTDKVWNPVTGCSKVSPGCAHCYAERVARRWHPDSPAWLPANAAEVVQLHPDRLNQPLHWRKPSKVFVNSMSDLFHEQVPFSFIRQVFATMALANQHTYQVLTKRPKRMLDFVRWSRDTSVVEGLTENLAFANVFRHVWLGVSVENQRMANERIPLLLRVPTTVRFVSIEPLLGPIDLTNLDYVREMRAALRDFAVLRGHDPDAAVEGVDGPCYLDALNGRFYDGWDSGDSGKRLNWVIVGGESGPKARPLAADWVRSLRDQCDSAGVPLFFKQWGGVRPGGGAVLDGQEWRQFPTEQLAEERIANDDLLQSPR